MTHDELLEKINEYMKSYGECSPYPCDDPDNPFFCAWKSLRTVVELHKPYAGAKDNIPTLKCCECAFVYPCPTIQAIEKELNGKS